MNALLTLKAQRGCMDDHLKTREEREKCIGLTKPDLYIVVMTHILLLVVLLSVSMKYVKRTEKVTVLFLCCSFLATCIYFDHCTQ